MRKVGEDEYTVRLLDDLPPSTQGFVTISPDGHYNVYLNARLNDVQQQEGFKHEYRHIANDDFFNGLPIREVEAEDQPRLRTHNPLGIPGVFMASDLLPRRERMKLHAVQVTPDRAIALRP